LNENKTATGSNDFLLNYQGREELDRRDSQERQDGVVKEDMKRFGLNMRMYGTCGERKC